VFDPRSRTETNCDWVLFHRDETRSARLGERFHGRNGSQNFPGCNRRPPLWVEGDRCVAHFHSDGSTNDWGVRFTAYGVMEGGEGGAKGAAGDGRQDRESAARIDMCCWLLEAFASDRSEEVGRVLYRARTLDTLRYCLRTLGVRRRVRLLHLLASLLYGCAAAPTPAHALRGPEQLVELSRCLRALIAEQLEAERSPSNHAAPTSTRSPYLQALVQCVVSVHLAAGRMVGAPATPPASDPSAVERCQGLVWRPSDRQGLVELSNGETTVCRLVEGPAEVVVAAVGGVGEKGVATWEVAIDRCFSTDSLKLGVAWLRRGGVCGAVSLWLSRSAIGASFGEELVEQRYDACGAATLLAEGDVVGFSFDVGALTLDADRNGVPLGRLLGPVGSGAFVEFNVPPGLSQPLGGAWVPAATLPSPGDKLRLSPATQRKPVDNRLAELLREPLKLPGGSTGGRRQGAAKHEGPNWFADVCRAVEMLGDFSTGRTPLGLLMAEYRPLLKAADTVLLQSPHPFDDRPARHRVVIEGAEALEVRVDEVTQLHDGDEVRARAPADPAGVLLLGPNATEPAPPTSLTSGPSEPPVVAGAVVVRSPSWRYGDEDGGPGSRGVAVRLDTWEGQQGMGVRVRWASGLESTYRLADVKAIDRRAWVARANTAVVQGDSLVLDVRPGPRASPSDAEEKRGFAGSLGFAPSTARTHAHAVVPAYPDLDLGTDFTVELWLRLRKGAAASGRAKCALSVVKLPGEPEVVGNRLSGADSPEDDSDDEPTDLPGLVPSPETERPRQTTAESTQEVHARV
jgi:hypothetical protein